MASSPNLSDMNYSFDKKKQYSQVVFQQGKPILDVDLNDMSNALYAQSTSALVEKMGYGASQIDFREWAMTAVDTKNPNDAKNQLNFAMTLGRLDTLKGVIDLHELRESGLDSRVIFDYGRIVDSSATQGDDRPYANYILKGKVTGSASTTTVIRDEHKNFSANHRLTAYTHSETITPSYVNTSAIANPSQTRATLPALLRIQEEACRLRFTSGALANQEQEIISVANGQITVGAAFTQPPSEDDEYVILPPNTLEDYRGLYNLATSQSTSKPEGLLNLPKLVTYVQVFEEDISSDEDSDIKSAALGVETTHRTQLRWCIRVATLRTSIDDDIDNNIALGGLKIEHINTLLNSQRLVEHHALADATDSTASSDEGALQTQYWQESLNGVLTPGKILDQESPYAELGLTPAHFFNSEEYTLDRLYWAFLKGLFLKSSSFVFNDFVILNVFNSETKSNKTNADEEELSNIFYPGAQTDTTQQTITHAFLSVGNGFVRVAGDAGAEPARFKSPPRVFHTHADLSVDNMRSRTLHGLRGGIIYGANAPLVFKSPASHFSFVDQMVLGMSGIGSAQGETSEGYRIPSAIDYTLANTTASLAQSGYDAGAIKMISPISASTISTGDTGSFLSGTASYLLREKGGRTSHTVNANDADLGWSLYKQEGDDLTDANNQSDFSIRGWEEGIAQAIAFQQGLNFRKLAIKTTAHKSMDLFTISETPRQQADQHDQDVVNYSSTAFQIPYLQSEANNGNLFLDSYSGSAGFGGADFLPSSFIPANVSRFDPKPLLQQYQATGGTKGYDQSSQADRDIDYKYGPWNRFNRADLASLPSALDNADAPTYSMDMWGNRCTAMRLRYHVGDFYPGAVDGRGVPSNQLVDSMNLFVKVEPLSLAHWMTMPKHQHSILENSISFAEGIEALLKVAHGLGDTQKLVNSSGSALVQETSPIRNNEFPLYPTAPNVGTVDPTNLPFEHYKQPFVHWYHPNMHKIKSPHPDGTNSGYDGTGIDITVYPKFGRRSLIVPALVPSKFGTYTDSHSNKFPLIENGTTGESYPELVGSDSASDVISDMVVNVSEETGSLTINNSILPYPYHGSIPTAIGETVINDDDGGTVTIRNNQITFPAVGTDGAEITPSPVFIPASRSFAAIPGTNSKAKVGFNTLIESFTQGQWNDVVDAESAFPYDEKLTHYIPESGGASTVPTNLNLDFNAWSVPVLRTAISTQTVSGIVKLVRTSFDTGLGDTTLSSDYSEFFTMPTNVFTNYNSGTGNYEAQQVPAIGPDNPVDTLFVGDLGTALGGFSDRAGFISPLNFGVPMRVGVGLMPNGMIDGTTDVRDSFEFGKFLYSNDTFILDTFTAISKMGLQQKLMWNCSFRVLHTRPGGMTSTEVSTAPKSITEVFLAHDRTDGNMTKKTFPAPHNSQKKPFIHLMSMHPNTNSNFPNKSHMEHLYPMISDSTGGTHESNAMTNGIYDYTEDTVKTSSMGDTFAVDPFDTLMNDHIFSTDNPTKSSENLNKNSGIEIDLISELNMIHDNIGDYGLNVNGLVNQAAVPSISSTMPTANELTLPGDHELVFVLYTGHYGAKMHDTNNDVNVSYIPPVAGCHLTATLEINRPSERISSTDTDNRHYGVTMNTAGDAITTYAIPGTKLINN